MKWYILISIIVIVVALGVFAVLQIKKDDEIAIKYSEGLKFKLNKDGASYSVAGIGSCKDTIIVIPNEYNNMPVTSIADSAFKSEGSLKSVAIPEGVTSIGVRAFEDCDELVTVRLPKSLTSIGTAAFEDCESIKNVYYSGDVASWITIKFSDFDSNPMRRDAQLYFNGNFVRSNGELVTSVTIPNGVKSIPDYAFYYCSQLKSITIPDSVTSIGDWAFADCSSITNITLPDSLTSIGASAFYNCKSITSITIPISVKSIDWYAFQYCTKLTSINYEGTLDQWLSIEKGHGWNNLVPATKVICTDGSIYI